MTNLRYSPDIERPSPGEQDTIDGIIKGMTERSEVVERREGHAVRASHAGFTRHENRVPAPNPVRIDQIPA